MPCDSVQTITIDLSGCNRTIMAQVMKEEGIGQDVIDRYCDTGRLRVSEGSVSESGLKQKYAKKILQKAKDFGWSIKQNADGTFQLQKASF